ncbi:MAG: DUF1311 domain-containing protein [Proteobacteria bacterium]|nr:DUF1311 domain-containing protein [Pseudomonadota bacterium]
MIAAALALAGALATAPPPPRDGAGCDGNTLQIDACLAALSETVDQEHLRYVAAARARLKHDAAADPADPGAAKAVGGFEASEAAWLAYRKAECGAVYDNWSGGTIRGAMYSACSLRLTRLRTHTVWLNWLTYPDSTPPVLPEPAVPPVR